MSEETKIEWADNTWNPWTGCRRVSPGCQHCYMFTWKERFGKKGTDRERTSAAYWKQPAKWNRQAEIWNEAFDGGRQKHNGFDKPIRPRVFPSLCDWLDDEVPIEWLADFLKLIHDTPNLDWLLLTKRPENFKARLEAAYSSPGMGSGKPETDWIWHWSNGQGCIPNNILIGASVEDQPRADERIPALLKIPARVRFLSVEPLLGPVNLSKWIHQLNWIICGGES